MGRPPSDPAIYPAAAAFEESALPYDRWYDQAPGRVLFQVELEAVRLAVRGLPRPFLEVGVGTGRFAEALGVEVGVDLARAVLEVFARRTGARPGSGGAGRAGATRLLQAAGEALPFRDGAFGAALLILTLCFAADPKRLLSEAARVVRAGGAVVACVVDRESAWGRRYLEKKAQGDPFYRYARFFTGREVVGCLQEAGLTVVRVVSTLTRRPDEPPAFEPPRPGLVAGAGFVCVAAARGSSA